MLPNYAHLLTDFRTVFVFALGPFLPMFVIFFDFNGNFNGKMAKNHFSAKKNYDIKTVIYKSWDWVRPSPPKKTKTVLKSVSKWAQFGSMQDLKF